jgi:predicted alpha/beta-hydrolase family hydrolase
MKVIFSHGQESGPWGTKIKALADIAKQYGHEVDSIDYTDISRPDERAGKLITVLADITQPVILVGSSMGGYVSLVASEHSPCEGLFMIAPALYMPQYAKQHYASMSTRICVVHGLSDDVIPYQHSQQYAQSSACELHLIEGDHRLNSSLDEVCRIFHKFLASM